MTVDSEPELEAYCAPLRQSSAGEELAARTGLPLRTAILYLDAVCNEARTGLRLLDWAGLRPGQRVLEVGAGGGLLTGFLQSRGVDLMAIEPAADGFEATPKLAAVISETTSVAVDIRDLSARELNPTLHGSFDIIFSVNVIEHFQPMNENLDALASVMGRRGLQVHTCPNYHVPYEPHFGILLLPLIPQFTPYRGSQQMVSENTWRSLNFITSSDLRAYAKRYDLEIVFKQGELGEALERLCAEPEFAARHPAMLRSAASLMKTTGLTGLLKKLPPGLVTPMTVMLRRDQFEEQTL